MLNLSLHGSSMNLNKCGVSSARTAKTSSRDTKSWNERTSDPQKSHKISSGNKTVELHQPDSDVHLSLDDSDEDCPVLQRATVPTDDDRLSPTDLARSKRNVSEWLTTCVNDELVNWEKIDMISVASTFTDSQKKVNGRRKIKHDPELRILLDSLDATPDLEKDIKIQNSGNSSQRTLAGQEHEIVEASDTNDEPPPCQARPQSNSLISVRTKDGTGTAEAVTNKQGFLMHDQAARIIQGFWRRHRRRKLAAQAALRRMMAEQKRRLDETVRSQGMPLRAAQARQKQMNEKRVLEEHRKRIRALRAKSTNLNLPEAEFTAINETQLVKDSRPAYGTKEILSKPASPMITPRQARYSGASNRSITLRKEPTIDQEKSSATPNHGTNCDETDHNLAECAEDQFEIQSHGRSTMDEIIQDLGRLGSVDEVDPDDLNIKHSEANRIITPLTDLQAESNSKGWSEMFHEIHRVLSEPDEVDQYSYKTNDRSSSRRSETPRVKEIFPTSGILRPMTVDLGIHKMRKTANVSDPPTLLTKRNVQEHNRQITTLSSERRAAKQELDNTIQLTRSTLARIVPRSNHPEQNYFNQTCPTRKPTATTRTMTTKTLRQSNAASCRNEVALGGLDRSGYYQNANVVWDQMGESFHSVLSHAYTDPAYTAQLPAKNDVTVNTLQMQLEQQSFLVQRLQTTIDQQRELSTRQLRDTQQEAEKRLESIKVDYEATLKRNYTLIDELVEEKKALHVKCEALLTELKTVAQKSEEKLKVTEDRHKIELKKLEAKMTAAEKLRREKWEAEKTKQMKEMTVRGMESELARLIASHQAEMRQIRQSCAEQVQAADIRAYQAYTGQIEEIRQTLTREKDEACAREREAATQRLEKTLSDERAALDQQRRRLMNEVAEERERIALTCAREREEIERGRQNLESRLETLTSKYERELVQQREELVKRHEKELEELQLREHAEREAWEEHTKSVLEVQCSARENGLRDQLKRERDRQLEAAIRRLEKESNETRAEVEREAESKIKRIREKLGAEITEIERSERQAMEKYCEMKTKLLDKEHESDRLRIQLQQREQEMHDIRALYEKLNQERQNMSDVVRQEFADRLVTLEEENRTVKRELAEFKARLAKEQERHESDLAALKRANADELEAVHQKIKDAIKRKDEKTNQMRNHFEKELQKRATEMEEANRRAEHLEELLDQQRKQFLQTMR